MLHIGSSHVATDKSFGWGGGAHRTAARAWVVNGSSSFSSRGVRGMAGRSGNGAARDLMVGLRDDAERDPHGRSAWRCCEWTAWSVCSSAWRGARVVGLHGGTARDGEVSPPPSRSVRPRGETAVSVVQGLLSRPAGEGDEGEYLGA
jgi:hypothetical protein